MLKLLGAGASLSTGAYALIKKIPLLGEYLRYEEGKEKMHDAVDERFTNEYKILNDPKTQIDFINSFPSEVERKLIIGHIFEVQADSQKCLNIVDVLKRFYENVQSTDEKEVDDKQMDPDWWMLWLDRAKMTSNPQKQEILAKALELENKKQGTISARFIRVLGDMSADDLKFFEENVKYFSIDGYLYKHANAVASDDCFFEVSLNTMKKLEGFSIARFASGIGEYHQLQRISNGTENFFYLTFHGYSLFIWKEQDEINFTYSMSLTEEGCLLKNLLCPDTDMDLMKMIAQKISKQLTCRVTIHKMLDDKSAVNEILFSFENGVENVQ